MCSDVLVEKTRRAAALKTDCYKSIIQHGWHISVKGIYTPKNMYRGVLIFKMITRFSKLKYHKRLEK